MSVYSGFVTRKQEGKYNRVLYRVVMMIAGLAKRLWMKEYGEGRKSEERKEIDFRVAESILKDYQYLVMMDNVKHLEPKFSNAIKPFFKGMNNLQLLSNKTAHISKEIVNTLDNSASEIPLTTARNFISRLDLTTTVNMTQTVQNSAEL